LFSSENGKAVVPLDLNIALHLGTLISILIVFFRDILRMLQNPRTIMLIIIATIPAGIIGITCKKYIEEIQDPIAGGVGLLITATFLWLGYVLGGKNAPRESSNNVLPVENASFNKQEMSAITPLRAFLIGCFQALAILPGVSRSGSTISSSLAMKIPQDTAAKFSFLMAVPVIAGAVLLDLKDVVTGELIINTGKDALILGIIVSCVVGYFALTLLLKILKSGKFHYFAIYCLLMGIFTLVWFGALKKVETKTNLTQIHVMKQISHTVF
jgi:undecaprenyl-diphosphatase